jgi:hypothetical protein
MILGEKERIMLVKECLDWSGSKAVEGLETSEGYVSSVEWRRISFGWRR